ncbi:MAG: hypothetical protein ACREE0_19520 [Phenylobacterium sp.]
MLPVAPLGVARGGSHLPKIVVGHHGTRREYADRILGGDPLRARQNNHDWLGTGIYFWQDGEQRARVWARATSRSDGAEPAVIAADVDLDGCLDLFDLRDYRTLLRLYREFERLDGLDSVIQAGLVVVEGRQYTTADPVSDPLTRQPILNKRDSVFIDWAVRVLGHGGRTVRTVRGAFISGHALFPESFLFDWSHAQISVIDPSVITNVREV